jgi:uncharacterized membrane protein
MPKRLRGGIKMQNIHPLFVHFPIALLSIGLLCDILGSTLKKDSLHNSGWWCQVFGTVAIIVTITTGLLAERTVGHSDASHNIMETHKLFELIAVGFFAVLFIWRSICKTLLPQTLPLLIVYFITGAFAVGIMFYGAHLGGRLVYEFGIGGSVVPHSEGAGHRHNYDKATEFKAEHNHDTGVRDSINNTVSSPVDTALEKEKKIYIHKDGKEHTH